MVRLIPGDGHCLFASLVNQYYGYELDDQRHGEGIISLRRMIVEHIKQNADKYQPCLRQTVAEEGWNRNIGTDQAVEEFLNRLESGREWGGEESISAASEILRCRIDVYQEEGPIIKYNLAEGANKTLRIAYRLPRSVISRMSSRTRDHYDSIDRIIICRAMENTNTQASDSGNQYIPPIPQLQIWQQNAIPNDLQISQRTIPLSMNQDASQSTETDRTTLKIANWNVRGCSEREKREELDLCFHLKGYSIVALQETRMAGCTIDTQNYHWFNVNDDTATQDRIGGGTAILISKAIYEEGCFKKISNNSCSVRCKTLKEPFIFVSTYIRSAEIRTNNEFDTLAKYVSGIAGTLRNRVIIAGDMNARIGKNDLAEDDKEYIGGNLLHDESNANGIELKTLLHCLKMRDYLTLSKSKSVSHTWSNRTSTSQIDHILMNRMNDIVFPEVRAFFHPSIISDHKILECTIKSKRRQNPTDRQMRSAPHPTKKLKLDLDKLKTEEECRERYQRILDHRLRLENRDEEVSTEEKWRKISEAVNAAAQTAIGPKKSPQTPRRAAASKRYFLARQKLLEDRNNEQLKKERAYARKLKEEADALHFEEKVKAFLDEIQNTNQLEQMTKTFRFLKQHKRNVHSKKKKYIRIQKWEEKLKNAQRNAEFVRLDEEGSDLGPEPTKLEIENIIKHMKNNAAPGTDGLPAELFKYGTEELVDALWETMKKAFVENVIPKSWTNTLQIPIPKIGNPQKVEDYRLDSQRGRYLGPKPFRSFLTSGTTMREVVLLYTTHVYRIRMGPRCQ